MRETIIRFKNTLKNEACGKCSTRPVQILQEPLETVTAAKNTEREEEGSACASEPVRDALQKAVMDFEETLQRSSSGRRTTSWLPDVLTGK